MSNQHSYTYIILQNGPQRTRLWLDEDALDRSRVHAPDGTCEQCVGCGTSLAEASVTANAHGTKVTCDECGEVYPVLIGD